MPSSLSNFASNTQILRPKIEVDLDGTGFVDYTQYLDNYTVLQSTEGQIYGLYEMVLDAELFLPNPSLSWSKSGLPVRASIAISNDNFTTSYSEQLFYGNTVRQNSVPINSVKIKANSANRSYLDKVPGRTVYTNQDISTIISTLLQSVGVALANISLVPSGIVLPVYYVSDKIKVRDVITDLAMADVSIYGFDKDNIFTKTSLQKLTFGAVSTTPDITVTLDTQYQFKQQDITSQYYANSIVVKGRRFSYQVPNQIIQYDNAIQNQKIEKGGKLFYRIELINFYPEYVEQFGPDNSTAIDDIKPSFKSFYRFFTTDGGDGILDNSQIFCNGAIITDEGGKAYLTVIFYNNSAVNDYYLKSITVKGPGARVIDQYEESRIDNLRIAGDGQELKIEVVSDAIQSDVILGDVANILQLNLFNYADVYKFGILGRPESKIGAVISFKDSNNTTQTGFITEVDIEVGDGYYADITAKLIRTDLNYLNGDDATTGADDSAIAGF